VEPGLPSLPLRPVEVLLLALLREKLRPNTESLHNLERSHLLARKVSNKTTLNTEKRRAPQSASLRLNIAVIGHNSASLLL